MDQQRYVSIGDGNVYLASSDPLDVYNVLLAGLIRSDETPDFDGVTAIRFTGADDYRRIGHAPAGAAAACSG